MRSGAMFAASLCLVACTSGTRASDPPATAVRECHSAVAALALAVGLEQDGRATPQATQVVLEDTQDAVASAQQQLLTSADADPGRRASASRAVAAAADALVALGDRTAGELDHGDLERLQSLEHDLGVAAKDLQA